MDRDTVRPALIGLLAVLAIATAAATLTTPAVTDPGGGSGVSGDPASTDVGLTNEESDADPGLLPFESREGSATVRLCLPILTDPRVILGVVGLFALAAAHTYRRVGVFGPLAVLGGFGIPALLLHSLLTNCGSRRPNSADVLSALLPNTSLPVGGAPGIGGDGGTTGATTPPSALLTLVLVVAVVGSVALFLSSSGDDVEEDPRPQPATSEPAVEAVGRVAGAAADRIEGEADATNEIYRAWREMADLLPVDRPQSSTPAEFATAAVEAGMDRRDVDELTHLFEAVRYGGREPTAEREERAIAALRRIEADAEDEP